MNGEKVFLLLLNGVNVQNPALHFRKLDIPKSRNERLVESVCNEQTCLKMAWFYFGSACFIRMSHILVVSCMY